MLATRSVGKIWVALSLLASLLPDASGGTRRALLVGINIYKPAGATAATPATQNSVSDKPKIGRGNYSDLDGCVNDAEAVRAVLIAKYGFEPRFIQTVTNTEATRENILTAIREHLIDSAVAGDACFFFYAGHGSLIRNLKSNKPTGMDSTLVPADSYKGVMDIRDKELSRLFNKAVDKGVILTAVFDSCHSGSIARGLPSLGKSRDLPPDPRVISDPPDPGQPPEARGALIISAAQDYQTASECRDERGTPHGAFTAAFLKALGSARESAAAEEVFLSTQVILQAEQAQQVPVLAGTLERRRKPLLGLGSSRFPGRLIVGVDSTDPQRGRITLQGGRALGLNAGCELQRLPQRGEDTNQPAVRVRVTEVRGLAESLAKVTFGDPTRIKAGDVLGVDRWVYPSEATLRVWIPTLQWNHAELARLEPEIKTLRNSDRIDWVEDPTEETPTHILLPDNSGWFLSGVGDLGGELVARQVIHRLISATNAKPKLFLNLPASVELARELRLGEGTPNDSIEPVARSTDAQYFLVGRWHDERIQYAWVRPNSTQADAQTTSLPVRTDWFDANDLHAIQHAARRLEDTALRIGRLKAWLTLTAHGNAGNFPYRLALKNIRNDKLKEFGDTVVEGDSYGLELLADPGANLGRDQVEKRWIYVVAIDSWGKTQLVFPPVSQGNVGNRLPYDSVEMDPRSYPSEITLGDPMDPRLFKIAKPLGVDTYVLLTSREAISEPDLLESEGVRTRGAGSNNPLEVFLANVGARSRGVETPVPTDWSIQKMTVRSVSRPR